MTWRTAVWPPLAPPAIKLAVGGLYVIVVLVLVSVLTTVVTASGRSGGLTGSLLVGDLVLLAGLLLLARGIAVGRPVARWIALVVCVLGGLAGFTLLPSTSVLVQVVSIGQVAVFVAIAVSLLVRASGEWFRPLP